MPARRHLTVVLVLALVAALAVLLAATVTSWTLLALPFCLVGGAGAWLGMDVDRFTQALAGDDDAGRGVPGMLP